MLIDLSTQREIMSRLNSRQTSLISDTHFFSLPNSEQVYAADLQYFRTIEGRTASKITTRLQLQSIHFGPANIFSNYGGSQVMKDGGQLVLRCTAQIGNLYQEYTEKELGAPQKDPVPARGKQPGEGWNVSEIN